MEGDRDAAAATQPGCGPTDSWSGQGARYGAAMPELPPGLHPGMRASFILADGTVFDGELEWARKGWAKLRGEAGIILINSAHIAVIKPLGPLAVEDEDETDADLPRPRSNDRATLAGPTAPGRAWADDDLRRLADAFLDHATDAELAERHHRTKGAIKEARQGFECARGNLVEDQISQVACTWVGRWRKVLAKQ